MPNYKITKQAALKGASQITWNVDRDGKPYGQIWTFKPQKGCRFGHTAKVLLTGDVRHFNNYQDAEKFMTPA